MNDDKLDIKLKIAGTSYPRTITPQMEEVYRLAEREVNRHFVKYRQTRADGYAVQDYLAMVALDFAAANILMSQSREIGSEELKRLAELSKEVEAHLNK